MISFKQFISEETKPTTLGDLVNIKVGMEDADFWIRRRGDIKQVGHPTREYNPEHIGVKVTNADTLDPKYAYYMMQHLASSGYYHGLATGATNLVNISAKHIKQIKITDSSSKHLLETLWRSKEQRELDKAYLNRRSDIKLKDPLKTLTGKDVYLDKNGKEVPAPTLRMIIPKNNENI